MKKIFHLLSGLSKLLLVAGVSYIFVVYFVSMGRIEREARMQIIIEQRIAHEREKIRERWEEDPAELSDALGMDDLSEGTSVEDLSFIDGKSGLFATQVIPEDGTTDVTNTSIESI